MKTRKERKTVKTRTKQRHEGTQTRRAREHVKQVGT